MGDRFYKTSQWEKKRQHILKRDGYKDQLELRAGRNVPAELVHHIFPREQYPEYDLKDWNLISISKDTHKSLHLFNGELSPLGEKLKRETAIKEGLKYYERILVIGLPGTGKTTWAKLNLQNGLCFDLDYIAAAFRLKKAGEEYNKPARHMANALVKAWAMNAERYTSRIIIIRTAPTIEEAMELEPDKIICCSTQYESLPKDLDKKEKLKNIKGILSWAEANNIQTTRL